MRLLICCDPTQIYIESQSDLNVPGLLMVAACKATCRSVEKPMHSPTSKDKIWNDPKEGSDLNVRSRMIWLMMKLERIRKDRGLIDRLPRLSGARIDS